MLSKNKHYFFLGVIIFSMGSKKSNKLYWELEELFIILFLQFFVLVFGSKDTDCFLLIQYTLLSRFFMLISYEIHLDLLIEGLIQLISIVFSFSNYHLFL